MRVFNPHSFNCTRQCLYVEMKLSFNKNQLRRFLRSPFDLQESIEHQHQMSDAWALKVRVLVIESAAFQFLIRWVLWTSLKLSEQ